MVASAGGLDLLVFTGGIGEHVPAVRTLVVSASEETEIARETRDVLTR